MTNEITSNRSRSAPLPFDLDLATDEFEEAAFSGNGRALDQIVDRLRSAVKIDSPENARLSRMEATLDRLGARARSGHGPTLTPQDNELIQRLRTGILAAMDNSDGLRTTLGDVRPQDLLRDGRALVERLRSQGFSQLASAVESALGELGKLEPKSEPASAPSPALPEVDDLLNHLSEVENDRWLRPPPPPEDPGLRKLEDGTIVTKGGYQIKAEGKDSAWSITDPNGKPVARIWGDPHVDEGDGTRWDFSRDSEFRLPDGTSIFADTDFEPGKGQSITRGLVIDNGTDRVDVRGIDSGKPETSDVYRSIRDDFSNGFGVRNDRLDVFSLVSEGAKVEIRKNEGGIINGARLEDGEYRQTTDE